MQTENCIKMIWNFLQNNPSTLVHFTCMPKDQEITGLVTVQITKWFLDEANGLLHGEGPGGRAVFLASNLIYCEEKDGMLSVAYAGTYYEPAPDSVLWVLIFEPF